MRIDCGHLWENLPSRQLLGVPLLSAIWLGLLIGCADRGESLPRPKISYAADDLVQPDDRDAELGLAPGHHLGGLRLEAGSRSELQLSAAPLPFLAQSVGVQPDLFAEGMPSRAEAATPNPPPKDGQSSPVFEKWQKRVPNVLEEIKRDPSFRTRVRLGLSYFPSTFDSAGWNVGIEDLFLARIGSTGLTVSGDYQATFTGRRKAGGAVLRYYLLPVGGSVNLAPVLGYRYLETPRYNTDGLNVGVRLQLVPFRTGGADLSLTQTWVAPRRQEEVGITALSFGYALTKQLRVSTDIEKQNSRQAKDTRFAIALEWMF